MRGKFVVVVDLVRVDRDPECKDMGYESLKFGSNLVDLWFAVSFVYEVVLGNDICKHIDATIRHRKRHRVFVAC